jgi:CDP-diacylglycerol--glycerol-3-phosphate 3-phosphatidyltransferase
MISNRIGHRLDPYFYRLFKKILGGHIPPNLITLMGFFSTLLASFLILKECLIGAGLLLILSGVFDMLDGVMARKLGKATVFGGFLDSVMDRYSDLLFLLSLLIYYLKNGSSIPVILTSVVSIGIALIPYVRARAEAANVTCNVGLMERAERIILLSAGTLFGVLEPVLWILAVLTHFTVLQRIYHVWKKLHPTSENENHKSQTPNKFPTNHKNR